MRKCVAIMYHDVFEDESPRPSGFAGAGADLYKLAASDFAAQLAAIRRVAGELGVGRVDEAPRSNGRAPLYLTFDDGGESASTLIAGALERHGWRGHFFVTTDYIGKPGFLTGEQIRDLRARGHVIGSHSCSHPPRMSHCTWDRLLREWTGSVRVLSGILDEPVRTASVPGGYYSREVAEAAAQAGIRFLFTSEPTMRPHTVRDCLVLGRYFVQRGMPPSVAAGFAAARAGVRWKQALLWKAKKAAKAAGGEFYLRARSVLLARNGRQGAC